MKSAWSGAATTVTVQVLLPVRLNVPSRVMPVQMTLERLSMIFT